MDNLLDILKKVAIAVGLFLLLVACSQGPQEAAGIGKEIVSGTKEAAGSVVIFVKEVWKAI